MKLIRVRCLICLAWHNYKLSASHCPHCGATRVGHKHYAYSDTLDKLVEIFSAVHVPLALRNNYYTR